jgi:hypothetical protein
MTQAESSLNTEPGRGPGYVLIQEGGTSRELYLHAWGSSEDAEQDRIDCSNNGAYRTTRVVEVPASLASHRAFYDVAESLVRQAHGAFFDADTIAPAELLAHPGFEKVMKQIVESMSTLECVEVPEEVAGNSPSAGGA